MIDFQNELPRTTDFFWYETAAHFLRRPKHFAQQ
jgi:hypothetical protein